MEDEIEYRGRRVFATPIRTESGHWRARARIEFHHAADVEMKVVDEPEAGRTFTEGEQAVRRSQEIAMRWIDTHG